jgi:hypothetical protein
MEGRRQRRFADCRPASRAKEAAIAVGVGDAQLMVKLALPKCKPNVSFEKVVFVF